MDDRSFDRLARALGGAPSRRGVLGSLVGLLAGVAAMRDSGARRGSGRRRGGSADPAPDDPRAAAKRKRRKRCTPKCAANFRCERRECVCDTVLCGTACCDADQICQRGECVAQGTVFCHARGEACGDGARCCDGLRCGSGYGGGPVACWPKAGEACIGNEDCLYAHHCENGTCVDDCSDCAGQFSGNGICCGGSCVDRRSPAHCGTCGMICDATTPVCDGLACRCTSTSCASGQVCTGGSCCTPKTCAGLGKACGSWSDGCGGALSCGSCTGTGDTCSGTGACVCGSGASATACTGGKACQSGTCTCPIGQTDCGGTCRNLMTDNANCGACGTVCTGPRICAYGQNGQPDVGCRVPVGGDCASSADCVYNAACDGSSCKALWTPAALTTPPTIWVDASNPASLSQATGPVAAWNDLSGNARNFTQATAASQPAAQANARNGKTAVQFNGSAGSGAGTGMNSSGTGTGLSTAPYTYVLVFKASANVLQRVFEGFGTGNPANTGNFAVYQSGVYQIYAGGGANGGTCDEAWHLAVLTFASVSATPPGSTIFIDGDQKVTGYGDDIAVPDSYFTVGRGQGGTNPFTGDIGEAFVLSAKPTVSERQLIEGYLAHKWGLAANLPGGHPYKTAPPLA